MVALSATPEGGRRQLLLLGLTSCTLSLGTWSGPVSGRFSIVATVTCTVLDALSELTHKQSSSSVAQAGVAVMLWQFPAEHALLAATVKAVARLHTGSGAAPCCVNCWLLTHALPLLQSAPHASLPVGKATRRASRARLRWLTVR